MATIIVKNKIGQLKADVAVEIRPIGLMKSKANKKLFQKRVSLDCGRCFFLDQNGHSAGFEIFANDILVEKVASISGNIRISIT